MLAFGSFLIKTLNIWNLTTEVTFSVDGIFENGCTSLESGSPFLSLISPTINEYFELLYSMKYAQNFSSIEIL